MPQHATHARQPHAPTAVRRGFIGQVVTALTWVAVLCVCAIVGMVALVVWLVPTPAPSALQPATLTYHAVAAAAPQPSHALPGPSKVPAALALTPATAPALQPAVTPATLPAASARPSVPAPVLSVADARKRLEVTEQALTASIFAAADYRAAARYAGLQNAPEKIRRDGVMDGRLELSSRTTQAKADLDAIEKRVRDRDTTVPAAQAVLASAMREEQAQLARAAAAAEKARQEQQAMRDQPPPPTPDSTPQAPVPPPAVADGGEHVGPRSGVYHYSKNGKKVYEKHR